jgi:hypothetical protein
MIVKKFGGEIDFISKYKKGTTFFYTFLVENIEEDELMRHLLNIQNKERKTRVQDKILSNAADNLS